MHIGRTTPDMKMRDIWLVSMPKFKGSHTIDSISRTSVPNMYKRNQGLTSESCRQVRLMKYGSNVFTKQPVCSFSNPILLRTSLDSVLTKNSILYGKLSKSVAHVLSTLVILWSLDLVL